MAESFPAIRDLAYEERNARVVWNSRIEQYVARPCHGVADPGAWQRRAIRQRWVRRLLVMASVLVIARLLWLLLGPR